VAERTLRVAVAEQTLWRVVGAPGALEALGRTVSWGGMEAEVVGRLVVHEARVIARLEHTHLVLYREEDLLALGCRHRYPHVLPLRQEAGLQALRYHRQNLGSNQR